MNADPYTQRRREMVARQIRARGIDNERVLRAMDTAPRHRFMPESARPRAYDDCAVGIGEGQTISQPYMVALMTDLLALKPSDLVLEIGTGSGYQTAILAELAAEVLSFERQPVLARRARETLDALGYTNVQVRTGDGTTGDAAHGPYDAILVTAGGPKLPPSLGDQLADGGRLVCPVGGRDVQELQRILRTPDGLQREKSIRCTFVPLIGAEGWKEPSV